MRRLDNFVGGESVAPKSKKYVELINPATGEPFAEMPVSNAADVDAALQVANTAFQGWKRTTPVAAQSGASTDRRHPRSARRRARRRRSRELREDHRAHDERRDPADDRPDPILRWRRPALGGPRRRGVHGGHDQLRPTRADRCLRRGDAVELPDDDGRMEVGAGDRGRQHDGVEAGRLDAGLHGVDGPAHGRGPAPGRLQRGVR